jgi:hypothetical protein
MALRNFLIPRRLQSGCLEGRNRLIQQTYKYADA